MNEQVKWIAEHCALALEMLGIAVIVVLAVYSLGAGAWRMWKHAPPMDVYDGVRQQLGRGILLGLELLVAADIIHTVAVDLSFSTVGVLAIVVAIRTFLSFSLEVELTGSWPWQTRHGFAANSGQSD